VKPLVALALAGAALTAVAAWLGGRDGAIGGAVAVGAQLGAVALLRPAMTAPQARFIARWAAGMAIRALALAGLLAVSITRSAPEILPASLGFLGVLLPLLFVETRFLT